MYITFDKKILLLLGFPHLFHDATIVKLTLLCGFGIKVPFSKFKKYFVFFSPSLCQWALDRIMAPRV